MVLGDLDQATADKNLLQKKISRTKADWDVATTKNDTALVNLDPMFNSSATGHNESKAKFQEALFRDIARGLAAAEVEAGGEVTLRWEEGK
eukprot:CAMPEP_0185781382 /NCGR_PEP_ID=MMETSP1174-20130828/102219_1 /TAXON_ID=35687 /ORGANISM="Dictyocha speculum, Strain CCMP1381" /LENGTH=90 /DNA_ID=CAMNT_0028471341 /DNA_START=15 /DNA_END=284 /DNA_ORIENTATION=-